MGCILYILSETYLVPVPNFNQYIIMIKVLAQSQIDVLSTFTDRDVNRGGLCQGTAPGHT